MSGRVAALAGALGALLAVVAAAAAVSAPAADREGTGLPPGLGAYAYAALFLVSVAGVPVLVLLGIRELPEARRRGRRTWITPLALAFLALGGVALSSRAGDGLSDVLARIRLVEPSATPAEAARPPASAWVPLLLVSTLVVGGIAVLGRRPRSSAAPGDGLDAALALPLADLRTEPDVRRAIVAAFARLEAALEAAGAPRSPGEAPLEYVGRVLAELDVPAGAAAGLAHLFERARFSLHPLGERERDAAIAALEAVREALR